MKTFISCFVVAAVMSFATGVEANQAKQAKSLAKCQQTVAKESRVYLQKYGRAMDGCLNAVAKQVVGKQTAPAAGSLEKAAKRCQRPMRALTNSDAPEKALAARLATRIAAACDPAANPSRVVHTAADVVGGGTLAQSIAAGELSHWCTGFGGDGTLSDIDAWRSCLQEALTCQALHAVAARYPRAAEWLAAVKHDLMAGDPGCASGCGGCSATVVADACTALEDATSALVGKAPQGRSGIQCGRGRAFPASGQLTAFGPHSDGAVRAGAALAFVDNGDGTITDLNTGLMWEKKVGDPSSPRYYDRVVNIETYPDELNDVAGDGANCFAGYCDWRMPNVLEATSILDFEKRMTTGLQNPYPDVFNRYNPGVGPCSSGTPCSDITDPDCSCASKTFETITRNPRMIANSFSYRSVIEVVWTGMNWRQIFGPNVLSRAVRGGMD